MKDLIPLAKAVELLPKKSGNKSVHVATLYRWSSRGVHGVRLKTFKVGRQRYTSSAALVAFAEALAEADLRLAFPVARPATSREREVAARRARQTLRMETASDQEAP